MSDTTLSEKLTTRVGYAADGENYYSGYALAADLMQRDVGFWSLVSVSIGHRLLTQSEETQLNALNVSICAADPRIWPHKLMRLAAAHGSIHHSLAAIENFSENALVGPDAIAETAQLYHTIRSDEPLAGQDIAIGKAVSAYTDVHRPIPSFGTPMRAVDERCIALDESRKQHGIEGGEYWKLYKAVTRYVESRNKVKVNIAGAVAATLLDVGFSVQQVKSAAVAIVMPVWLAQASEGAEHDSSMLQCLPDELIDYKGPPFRESPKAIARKRQAGSLS